MVRSTQFLGLVLVVSASVAQAAPAPGAAPVHAAYDARYAARLVPLLSEVLRFPTVQGNTAARDAQQAWVRATGAALGLQVRDAGLVTEVELAGPPGAPVLGLIVHGDVQPVNEAEWTVPPFAGLEKGGVVYGRGAADDKGPLVQALLTLAALRDSGLARTYTVRLLVGSDEESTNQDFATYLKTHAAPDLSLVLDSGFPVVVGEKAWSAFTVTAADAYRMPSGATASGYRVTHLEAGLSPSIVPSLASAQLQWQGPAADEEAAFRALAAEVAPAGYGLAVEREASGVNVVARGRAAHSGVNIEGGRNALVFLARVLEPRVVVSPASDLLRFAGQAGSDIYGAGLGLATQDPVWGHYAVNVATVRAADQDPAALTLTINVRAIPALWGEPLRAKLEQRLAVFNAEHGEHFTAGGFFGDPPLVFDTHAKLVTRLMADYARATGEQVPWAISGGGTYAKRLPNAIAFGMWFPGKPYPGHDVDEQITVADLQRGVSVLIEALTDLATAPPLQDPLKP